MNRKLTAVMLSAFMLMSSAVALDASTDTVSALQSGDFKYYLVSSNEVEIAGYTGSENAVTVPNTIEGKRVIGIYKDAFASCSSLTSIVIPDSVTYIDSRAFSRCTALTTAFIGSGVTTIGDFAFWGCSDLTDIAIPDGVRSIGNSAFSLCSSLTSIAVPDGVRSIGNNAFQACSSLKSASLGNGVTTIGISAFGGCNSLTNITIPDSVITIGNRAFSDCSSLTSIAIPDSVTTIGDFAFYNCPALIIVTIPDSVTTIGEGAFEYCVSLTNINVDAGNSKYSSLEGVLFNKDRSILIQCPGGKSGSITIPDSVTTIGDFAFADCPSITSIAIPDSVTTIGDGAFACDSTLTAINVDAGNSKYASLEGVLFNKACSTLIQCPSGKSGNITIPDSVTTIGDFAFQDCSSLTSITIPGSVRSIKDGAFYHCSALTTMTFGGNAPQVGLLCFIGCDSLTVYYQPTSIGFTAPSWNGIPCEPVKDLTDKDESSGPSTNKDVGIVLIIMSVGIVAGIAIAVIGAMLFLRRKKSPPAD